MALWRKKPDLGCWGEEQAKRYLKKKGYKILAEHWTSRIGELDIVAFKSGLYVFVEVKTRTSSEFGALEETVPFWKQEKLKKTAELFLLKNKLKDVPWQIDVVAIFHNPVLKEMRVKHLENAVSA